MAWPYVGIHHVLDNHGGGREESEDGWNVTGKAGLEVRGYEVSRLKDERTSRERERVPKYWC